VGGGDAPRTRSLKSSSPCVPIGEGGAVPPGVLRAKVLGEQRSPSMLVTLLSNTPSSSTDPSRTVLDHSSPNRRNRPVSNSSLFRICVRRWSSFSLMSFQCSMSGSFSGVSGGRRGPRVTLLVAVAPWCKAGPKPGG
jgi:hypothetical protein